MTRLNYFLLREPLLAAGYTPSAIQHRVDSGSWSRVFNGIYLPATCPDSGPGEVGVGAIRRQVGWQQAVLRRGGPLAVLSHDTAAIHHGLDSTSGWDKTTTHITVPNDMSVFQPQTMNPAGGSLRVSRTRHLPVEDSVVHDSDGRRFTGRARTLLDVASGMSDREFSLVLESGLRGADPKQPHVWREDVLAEVCDMVQRWRRKPGATTVRIALARRVDGRPTGSIADSTVLFALLAAGITGVVVQPRVLAVDRNGHVRVHFADLMIPSAQLIIEIDGAMHTLPDRIRQDHERDRRFSPGFHVFRYPASVALFDPGHIVKDVKSHLNSAVDLGNSWDASGRHVEGSAHEWSITSIGRLRTGVA